MCMTHQWDFGTIPVTAMTQCPMGRIEEKADEAIAKIDALTEMLRKDKEPARPEPSVPFRKG